MTHLTIVVPAVYLAVVAMVRVAVSGNHPFREGVLSDENEKASAARQQAHG